MIHYVDTFQQRFHHPKEDAYLFRPLRQRHPDAGLLIEQLNGNADPLFGASANADFEALFRRIVNLAPPPIGVGPVDSYAGTNRQ